MCITDGCSGTEVGDGSPEGLSPMVKLLFRGTGKSKERVGSSLHPHCHSSTWKIPILSEGSWKKELCESGKEGSVSTKQTEIMSQATEVMRSLGKKKKKQYPFYFLSAVLDFKIHYTLNAYTVKLFFSNKRTRFFLLYTHKQSFSCKCDRG